MKSQEVKEWIKNDLETAAPMEFSIVRKPSRTWGYTMQLWYRNTKIWTASGCGYNKEHACIEYFLTLTHKYYKCPLNGCAKDFEDVTGWTFETIYEGKSESAFRIRKM